MGAWSSDSKSHVAHMQSGDFYGSEQSVIMSADDSLDIEFDGIGGKTLLTRGVGVTTGEVVDAAFMSKKALCSFLEEQIDGRGVAFDGRAAAG